MWNKPWGYKEGFAINAGLILVGLLLQLTIGQANLDLLAFPVNVIALIIFLLGLIIMQMISKKVYLFRMMSAIQFALPSLASVSILIMVMGILPQLPSDVKVLGITGKFGFSQMLSAWYFVMSFLWLIIILGMIILKRISRFNIKKDIPFVLNHLGLFIALLSGVLGAPDLQRLKLTASIGKPEWSALNSRQKMVALPFAIVLHHFTIDEYPPRAIVNKKTGEVTSVRDPRRYASDVTVYTKSKKIINGIIEVNKPLKIEGWKIYQMGYDKNRGKWSNISIFELVRDPWLPAVYTGVIMMIAGAVSMFVFTLKRKEEHV